MLAGKTLITTDTSLAEIKRKTRNKAIDDFAECFKNNLLNNYRHLITTDTDGFDWLTVDAVETYIDEVVKQLRI